MSNAPLQTAFVHALAHREAICLQVTELVHRAARQDAILPAGVHQIAGAWGRLAPIYLGDKQPPQGEHKEI